MTAQDITDFVSGRGDQIDRADLARLNGMLFELPLEEVSDVRMWVMEGIYLTVSDPLYQGDISVEELQTTEE
jgi:hypothetical protein